MHLVFIVSLIEEGFELSSIFRTHRTSSIRDTMEVDEGYTETKFDSI
jgi:hypothetical protein